MKKLALTAIAGAASLVAAAKPMIDDAHDRVQTTLDPMMDRIGTLTDIRPKGDTFYFFDGLDCEHPVF